MKLLYSKKNILVLESDSIVKKIFNDELDFYSELNFYEQFLDFPYIPKLLETDKMTLYLEYIHGKSLHQCPPAKKILLGQTLAHFHNLTYNSDSNTALIHYDTNLKNYIYANDQIYMLDFSEITLGHPLSDIYSILLFFCEQLNSTEFDKFTQDFLKIYTQNCDFSLELNNDLFTAEIERFETRREQLQKCIYNYDMYLINKQKVMDL